MHPHVQFGARENPASDRRHGSRLAVSTNSSSNSIGEENAQASAVHGLAESSFTDAHASPDTTTQAATGEKRTDDCRLLTIRDVAQLLRVPVSWVYEHTRRCSVDRMPGFRLGKYWRFNEADVRTWLRAKAQK